MSIKLDHTSTSTIDQMLFNEFKQYNINELLYYFNWQPRKKNNLDVVTSNTVRLHHRWNADTKNDRFKSYGKTVFSFENAILIYIRCASSLLVFHEKKILYTELR